MKKKRKKILHIKYYLYFCSKYKVDSYVHSILLSNNLD